MLQLQCSLGINQTSEHSKELRVLQLCTFTFGISCSKLLMQKSSTVFVVHCLILNVFIRVTSRGSMMMRLWTEKNIKVEMSIQKHCIATPYPLWLLSPQGVKMWPDMGVRTDADVEIKLSLSSSSNDIIIPFNANGDFAHLDPWSNKRCQDASVKMTDALRTCMFFCCCLFKTWCWVHWVIIISWPT